MVGEAIWLQRGESEMKCRDEQLRWCLVGWFVELQGREGACKRLKEKVLHLVRWTLEVGCLLKVGFAKELWTLCFCLIYGGQGSWLSLIGELCPTPCKSSSSGSCGLAERGGGEGGPRADVGVGKEGQPCKGRYQHRCRHAPVWQSPTKPSWQRRTDGSVLELSRSFMKDPSGKELVVRAKELEPYKAMELTCDLRGRILIAFLGKGEEHWGFNTCFARGGGGGVGNYVKVVLLVVVSLYSWVLLIW
ncbi:hypothetical protein CK203_028353 [Vitis vinifera]|uniref:Uncharacterized protein n=1 Tax=Vitis vinifera TaxID=29760 RepID=A0A438J082_VITVI|nr:hypothetical protein CK203_028353 [Vitis vinifera]